MRSVQDDGPDRLFDGLSVGSWPWPRRRMFLHTSWTFRTEEWAPEIDVLWRGDRIVVRADLPGMRREHIFVAVQSGTLVIRGCRREERDAKREDYFRSERATGEFDQAITLPVAVDEDAIEITYEDGVLEISIPVVETVGARSNDNRLRMGRLIQVGLD